MKIITNEIITKFKNYLTEEEKAKATIEKYIRDILAFMKGMCGREVEKTAVLEYKKSSSKAMLRQVLIQYLIISRA